MLEKTESDALFVLEKFCKNGTKKTLVESWRDMRMKPKRRERTILLCLALCLSACSGEPRASVRQVESVADAGGALAVYRHNALMDEKAVELGMIHPIAPTKRK